MIRFGFRLVPDWPALGWIARLAPDSQDVLVTHGPRVETHDDWFGEVVWAGDFAEAAFDRTDAVFGSGARIRETRAASAASCELIFVSAGSTVDRLQSIEHDGHIYVSNSLACLLAQVGGAPDATDRGHFARLGTIRRGLDLYERWLHSSAGPARLTYFSNLAWDGTRLCERDKPDSAVGGFKAFEDYHTFLSRSLSEIAANATDNHRRHSFGLLATISGGYDSSAAAVVAREAAGLTQAVTFERSDGSDSGREIAQHLGIELRSFARDGWRNMGTAEPPEAVFVAGDAKGEDVFLRAAEAQLAGRVLITGHNIGILYDRNRENPDAFLRRKDRSGTSVTEWRLLAGFIHCPAGYLGARHAADITRISRSPEMAAWSVGGSYDKPIARRILEEAGLARGAFGKQKHASSFLFFRLDDSGHALSPSAQRDLRRWLRCRSGAFLRKGKLPPIIILPALVVVRVAARCLAATLVGARALLPRKRGGSLVRTAARLREYGQRHPLFDYIFPWALDHVKRRYRTVLLAEQDPRSESEPAAAAEQGVEDEESLLPLPG